MNWFEQLMNIIMAAVISLSVVCLGLLATGLSAFPDYPAAHGFFWMIFLLLITSLLVLKWASGGE